jgi:hypothetical protein
MPHHNEIVRIVYLRVFCSQSFVDVSTAKIGNPIERLKTEGEG